MVRPFAGSTLTEITLRKLAESEYIPTQNIYLSAYESELKEIGNKVGVNVYERSERSAMWDGGPDAYDAFYTSASNALTSAVSRDQKSSSETSAFSLRFSLP